MGELSRIEGLGARRIALLEAAGVRGLRDLAYYLPRRYLDRTRVSPIGVLRDGDEALVCGRLVSVEWIQGYRPRLSMTLEDASGTLDITFFNAGRFFLKRFQQGARYQCAGRVSFFRGPQMAHPDMHPIEEGVEPTGEVLPQYSLTEEMTQARMDHRFLQKVTLQATAMLTAEDPLERWRTHLSLREEIPLLRELHQPSNMALLEGAWRELKIREAFPLCLRLEGKRRARQGEGRSWPASLRLLPQWMKMLPFELTGDQQQALETIEQALGKESCFEGLLQADVGAGKTVVAWLSCARVVEAGAQVAFMAPTEILARQHHQLLQPLMRRSGLDCGLLLGATPQTERQELLEALRQGSLPLIIGTHALFSETVVFNDLGYCIIDEQHRFGVEQRKLLTGKGKTPDVLNLTATPIPRTLAQIVHGDLEVISIREKPPGRLPIRTRMVPEDKREAMKRFLLEQVGEGQQVFWVVPVIEEKEIPHDAATQEVSPVMSLESLQRELAEFSGTWRFACLHGRQASEEKEALVESFRSGELDVLLATTVVEVGVDVPGANLMVIENPDRFGLAQLHQLRGRTGRGGQQAWCFLSLPSQSLPEETMERLREFTRLEDGFRLAEMDLQLRGPGSLLGSRQSGFSELPHVDLIQDLPLLSELRVKAGEWMSSIRS